jgi:hypothetical protein
MVSAGQSSQKAQLIYQHSMLEHQRRIADDIDAEMRERRRQQRTAPTKEA